MKQLTTLFLAIVFSVSMMFAGNPGREEKIQEEKAMKNLFQQGNPEMVNGTSSFTAIVLGTAYTVKYIDYLPSGHVYATAFNASGDYALYSADNGNTWSATKLNATTNGGHCNVAAVNDSVAVVGDYDGKLWRTEDYGKTFTEVYSYSNTDTAWFDGVKFLDGNVGFAVGDADFFGLHVVKTTDAGKTWTRLTNIPDSAKGAARFFAIATYGSIMESFGNNIWIAYYSASTPRRMIAPIIKSTDAGATWTWHEANLTGGTNNYFFRTITFADANNGWGVGRQITSSSTTAFPLHKTTDGGVTWSDSIPLEPGQTMASGKAILVKPIRSSSNLVVVGFGTAGARAWVSSDNGATFTSLKTPFSGDLRAVGYKGTDLANVIVGGTTGLYKKAEGVGVTFQVNMRIQMLASKFNKTTDYVVVRGNFQGWGGETHRLADGNNDSIYTGTFYMAENQSLEYKFVVMPGDKWESSPNRTGNITTSDVTFPVVYFNNDSTPPVIGNNNITFRVKMNIQMREEKFDKTKDSVFVRGDFQGWGGYGNKLTDADGDSIYSATFDVGSGTKIEYKFVIARGGIDRWESVSNRQLTLTGSPQNTPLDWFDSDSVFSGVLRKGNIIYTVDLGPWISLGVFDKAKDTLFVHGAFNGWGHSNYANSWMQAVPGTDFYTLNLATEGIVGEKMNYKFFVLYDLTLPGRSQWKDYFGWELPATVGGGNREIVYEGTNNQEIPIKYYNDVTPAMVIPSGTNVNVTLNMDLRPAIKASTTPFKIGQDTLFFVTNWENWARLQGWVEGRQNNLKYTDPDGDSIYTLSFQIKGPSPAVMQYQTEYIGAPAEGGGFDFGRYRTRYIRKTSGGAWPASYTYPTDVFTVNPPLVVEDPSVLEVKRVDNAIARTYELNQNYPNPFNPATTISYSIPADGFVTLKVFNIIGQEVATVVNENQKAGKYTARFDARSLASGVYMYRIEAGSFVSAKKMILMK
ncbi:MAG: T9SS type A sorting domain-containing protein [Bacteroidota bacterium]